MLHSCNTIALVIASFAASTWTHTRRTFAFQSHIRLKKLCLPPDGLNTAHKSITNVRDVVINQQKNRGASSTLLKQRLAFFDQIFGFLDRESISYRKLTINELHDILHNKHQTFSNSIVSNKVDAFENMLSNRTILLVGKGCHNTLIGNDAIPRNLFVLHLCPTLHLCDIQELYQQCHPLGDDPSTSSSEIENYAWLNALLTNAFSQYNPESSWNNTVRSNATQSTPSIVHLHQDVYDRNPEIVQSRLRSKCGIYYERIYARKTVAKRIHKLDFVPFLEGNHLWGATGSKFAYGLYRQKELLAVATFSSKRKVRRAENMYYSYELLRFCTKRDTTIVGGLTKLISAFVRDVPQQQLSCNSTNVGIDIITSIDRDFGCNTWPNFETMDIMDPVPMFVGEDGVRRHAVGAGLIPLEQDENSSDGKILRPSELLRAGLSLRLMNNVNQQKIAGGAWGVLAKEGFHPVFDAGVERLMCIINRPSLEQQETDCGSTNIHNNLSSEDLWDLSIPRFVTDHYSSNEVSHIHISDI